MKRVQILYFLFVFFQLSSCMNEKDEGCCEAPDNPNFIYKYVVPDALNVIKLTNGYSDTNDSTFFIMSLYGANSYSFGPFPDLEFNQLAESYGDTAWYDQEGDICITDTIAELNVYSDGDIISKNRVLDEDINELFLINYFSYKDFIFSGYQDEYRKNDRLIPLAEYNAIPDKFLMKFGQGIYLPDSIRQNLSGDYEFYFEYKSTGGKVLRDTVEVSF